MEDLPNDKSKIDRLRDALYSRKIKIKPSFVLDLHGHKTSTEEKWKEEKEESSKKDKGISNTSLPKKIFWIGAGFFALCLIVALYVYFSGSNLISPNKIKIEVVGPPTIVSGEETDLDVAITNDNDTTLEIADLLVEYPEGTRNASDMITPLAHDRVSFGDISPHTTVHRTVKSVLYGEEGKAINIAMSLEYRVANTSSVFNKDTAFSGLVGSSPLSVSVDALDEVNANQDYSIDVHVVSNSNDVIKNALLVGTLPYGYEPSSYSINPISGQTAWNLGDIAPHSEREIKITGKIYGTRDEQRVFNFNVGVPKADSSPLSPKIGAVISSVTHNVNIKKPFLGVSIAFGRGSADNSDIITHSGAEVDSLINWTNNLDVPLTDVAITATLSGNGVDTSQILPTKGFYNSNTGLITWNKNSDVNMRSLPPGKSGSSELVFDIYPSYSNEGLRLNSPVATLDVTIKAKRLLESGVPQEIVSSATRTIKVGTDAHFSSQITHTIGPIENEGNIPPEVGKETTYTITWAVTNTFNPLSDGKVMATLPDYMDWKNIISPSSENVSYNTDSRTITWNLGNIAPQSKGNPTLRKVSFQVGITPSTSQIGTVPIIQDFAKFTANDTFTNTPVSDGDKGLTTNLKTDPAFSYGEDQVVQ